MKKLFLIISQFVTCFNKILRIFHKEEKKNDNSMKFQ